MKKLNLILGAGCSYDLTVTLKAPTNSLRVKMASKIQINARIPDSLYANQWPQASNPCDFTYSQPFTTESHTFLVVGLLDNPLITCKKQLVHSASESKVVAVAVRRPEEAGVS